MCGYSFTFTNIAAAINDKLPPLNKPKDQDRNPRMMLIRGPAKRNDYLALTSTRKPRSDGRDGPPDVSKLISICRNKMFLEILMASSTQINRREVSREESAQPFQGVSSRTVVRVIDRQREDDIKRTLWVANTRDDSSFQVTTWCQQVFNFKCGALIF